MGREKPTQAFMATQPAYFSSKYLNAAGASPAPEGEEHLVTAERLRRRFERSVLGQHPLMPRAADAHAFGSAHEKQMPYPCGADTSFQDPTPMPFRFTADALDIQNARNKDKPPENPCYQTTASDIGKLSLEQTDINMRYYPMDNRFTAKFFLGNSEPKKKVNSGLNTAMDRSFVHIGLKQLACNDWSHRAQPSQGFCRI